MQNGGPLSFNFSQKIVCPLLDDPKPRKSQGCYFASRRCGKTVHFKKVTFQVFKSDCSDFEQKNIAQDELYL